VEGGDRGKVEARKILHVKRGVGRGLERTQTERRKCGTSRVLKIIF